MLLFIEVALGEGGETSCSRCASGQAPSYRAFPDVATDVLAAVESDHPHGLNLSFHGAEPLRYSAIGSVLALAAEQGVSRTRLDSDCAGLGPPETADMYLSAGVRHLRFSLLGPDADAHDAAVDQRGAFAGTLHGVQTFKERARERSIPVHVTARVPVCRHNLFDVPMIVTSAAEFGASAVNLIVKDVGLDPSFASPWLAAACDSGVVNGTWVDVEGIPYGFAAGWELHLACIYRTVQGAKTEACETCPLKEVCGGTVEGALPEIRSLLHTPPDAAEFAEAVGRGYADPRDADV